MSTVLVIDDDPMIVKLIMHKLTRLGYEVHVATDGEAGIAAAHQIRPDLVLVDWMMPNLTGLEFCQRLRASALAATPIVLLTARAGFADVAQGMEAGATEYITKPFSPRELGERVTALLEASASSSRAG